jgi:hypothetical protein
MNGLHEVQRDFSNFVLRESRQAVAGIIANGLEPAQRLAIYRNNTLLGLTEALRDVYSVVNRVVGESFFNRLAQAYILDFPPQSGCLLTFGDQFAGFLSAFAPAQGLPYLPDVARLEWFCHEAYHEADETGLDISLLAEVPANLYGELRIQLHATARFLASGYPVLRIWQANQSGYTGDDRINLDEGGCRLLVFRPRLEVEIVQLDDAEYCFLTALCSGVTLTKAVEQVYTADPEFEVEACLQRWLGRALLTGFSLA